MSQDSHGIVVHELDGYDKTPEALSRMAEY